MARTWTEEQKQAQREKMLRHASQNKNLQNEKEQQPTEENEPQEVPEPRQRETVSSEVDYQDLLRQIKELKDNQWSMMASKQGIPSSAIGAGGKLTGTHEKYSTAKDRYPNPSERLTGELKLQRFAFPINYELNYEVGVSEYTTIDNIRMREPKFTLELVRIVLDEETGDPTNGRYIICRLVMHEDPEAAMVIAREQGLEVESDNEDDFLNEMRYLRMRDWLLECFYPAPTKKESNKREMVINGKLVTYYEKNNEDGRGVMKQDWDNLPRIKF